jgi:lipoate-protein ligase A
MRYLDLTLPTAAENLALDEALLEEAERAGCPLETLRVWEPAEPMVVVGRSSRIDVEVHRDECGRRGIPILRRSSGGAAIVTGPGCLMYALVLSYQRRPELRLVDHAHRFVLGRVASALRPLVPNVTCRGTSDLAVGDLKFSGNSVRCKRDHFLYHGTILYDFPLDLIDQCLAMPSRQPDYRGGRAHQGFVTNLPLPPGTVRAALIAAWDATQPCTEWPRAATHRLAAEKYNSPEWNERL